jgi:hypothetical protein
MPGSPFNVPNALAVDGNGALSSLDGLQPLTSVARLTITNNGAVSNLDPITKGNLSEITVSLIINGMTGLKCCEEAYAALSKLVKAGGTTSLGTCDCRK